MAAVGLSSLPTELLLQIIWLSYNADICLTSRALLEKLPSPCELRSDILKVLFGNWPAAQKDPRLLKLQTCVPPQQLKDADDISRREAQQMVLASSWCTLQSLRRAASSLTRTWIERHWDVSSFTSFHKEVVTKALADVAHTSSVAVCIEHEDQKHKLYIYSPFHVNIACNLNCGRGIKCKTAEFLSGPILLTHHIPDRVLQSTGMSYERRNLYLKLFQSFRWHTFSQKWSDWQWSASVVREQIAAAVYRKHGEGLEELLELYKIQNNLTRGESHDFTELDEAFVPDMISLAACRGYWKIIETIIDVLHGKSYFPKKWFSTSAIAFLQEDSQKHTKRGDAATKLLRKLRENEACACRSIDEVEDAIKGHGPGGDDVQEKSLQTRRLHHEAPDPLVDIHKLWEHPDRSEETTPLEQAAAQDGRCMVS